MPAVSTPDSAPEDAAQRPAAGPSEAAGTLLVLSAEGRGAPETVALDEPGDAGLAAPMDRLTRRRPPSSTPSPYRAPSRKPPHPDQAEHTLMPERDPILITGAAGEIGGVSRTMVDMLIEQGRPVRALRVSRPAG
ncbi:hypothetical protein GCM10027074_54890 [Streptomyces deserti]